MANPSEITSTAAFEGVDVNNLRVGSLLDVETSSRHYQIECCGGNTIRVSGHPQYCSSPEAAQLHGSMDDDGRMEVGVIQPGLRLVFFLKNRPITTSKIIGVHLN
jgi:hypothetical protein